MIVRTKLLGDDGKVREGGEELFSQWQISQEGMLWLDIEGHLTDGMQARLTELGCHPLAITEMERERQPPKVHEFSENTFILFRGRRSIHRVAPVTLYGLPSIHTIERTVSTRLT